MRFENDYEAAKLFSSLPSALGSASPQGASNRLPRAAARDRLLLAPADSLPVRSEASRRGFFLPRCRHKACVFPAQPGGYGECVYHRRQSLEPLCFQSQQPSCLLLDQAKFGLPDSEPDDGRVVDRHRLAEERARFMLGEAA